MEDDWERRSNSLSLSREGVERRVRTAWSEAEVVEHVELTGGLVNTNLDVRLSGSEVPGRVVLRLYQRDPGACGKEAALLRAAREGGVPVPAVLHAEPAPAEGPPFSILEHADGAPMSAAMGELGPDGAKSLGEDVGAALAKIHDLLDLPDPGFFGSDLGVAEPFPSVSLAASAMFAELLGGRAGERLGKELRRRVEAWFAAREPRLEELTRTALVHADFKPTNLLVARRDGRWNLTAVLDWEFSFAFSPLFDVGQLFRYEDELPVGFRAAFVEAYTCSGGDLPAGWERLAKLLDLVNLLSFLHSEDERPEVHRTARRLLVQTLDRDP